jgi:arylsulfatase A-like enzyme
VRNPGDIFTPDDEETYALEVRRTDTAIARLADALSRRPDAAHTVLFITADHGEAFGEHGIRHHGHDLHDEVMRVPMIAWGAGPIHDQAGDAHLPSSTIEVAGWLERLIARAPLPVEQPVFARIPSEGDGQLALIDGKAKLIYHRALNFLELYDLERDPEERHNLAGADTAMVTRLGRELAPFYRALTERKQRDLRTLQVARTQDPSMVSASLEE